MSTAFDTLKYAQALEGLGIEPRQAQGMARALADALESSALATKDDIALVRDDLKAARLELKQDVASLEVRLLWRMVTIAFLQAGLIVTLIKFLPGPG